MITIIGSGKVGAAAALFTALKKLDDQILLLDIVKGLPQGEAMDLNHMLSEKGIDVEVRGSNDYSEMKDSKIVVVVAGSGRKPGMTRMDLLKINTGIVKDVVENIKKHAKDSMIIPVTNPLDPMTHVAYKVSGFKRNRIFGMGNMLDLSRFIQFIHEDDIMAAFHLAIFKDCPGIFNIVGDGVLPLSRVLAISGKFHIPLPQIGFKTLVQLLWYLDIAPAPSSHVNFLRYLCIADGSKAKKVMGFTPRFSTKDALLSFVGAERLREINLIELNA